MCGICDGFRVSFGLVLVVSFVSINFVIIKQTGMEVKVGKNH